MFDQIPLHKAKLGHYVLMPSTGAVFPLDCEASLNMLPQVAFNCQLMGYEIPIILEDETEAKYYFIRN